MFCLVRADERAPHDGLLDGVLYEQREQVRQTLDVLVNILQLEKIRSSVLRYALKQVSPNNEQLSVRVLTYDHVRVVVLLFVRFDELALYRYHCSEQLHDQLVREYLASAYILYVQELVYEI